MIVHVVGAPGSGKTTLAQALARDLGFPVASVDSERRKLLRPGQSWPRDDSLTWRAMQRHVEANPSLIVETMGGTPKSERLLEGRDVVTVLVSAPERIRHERIRDRARLGHDPMIGRPDKYVQFLTKIPVPEVTADAEWIGTHAIPGEQYDALVSTLRQSVGEAKQEESLAMTDTDMAVKFADGTDNVIEGIGIPYGGTFAGKDIQGESFTKSTDFCIDWFDKRPLLYDHALNGTIKTYKVGDVFHADAEHDDGVFVRAELNKRGRYYKVVSKLIEQGALGFSSGAVPYLVQQDAQKNITRWPWFELSLTTTPANPDAVVYAVKASDALDHMDAANIDIPAPVEAALKAFDEWAIEQTQQTSEPESYAEQTELVLAGLKAWVEDTVNRVEMRASPAAGGRKTGRELSKRNLDTLREAHRVIGDLLERADKPDEQTVEAAKSVAEHHRLEAALLGIAPD